MGFMGFGEPLDLWLMRRWLGWSRHDLSIALLPAASWDLQDFTSLDAIWIGLYAIFFFTVILVKQP